MDISLEDYISRKPTLQAAIIGARLRAQHERRFHNSDEFKSETRQYICTEMDFCSDSEPIDENGNTEAAKSTNNENKKPANPPKNTFEEAYLALDLNAEEEFDKWYEQLNSNLKAKAPTVATKERADSSNDNITKTHNISNDLKPSIGDSPNKINNLLNQPGFDLRQLVGEKNQSEQGSMPKNCSNNNKSKRVQVRRGAGNHRFAGNNAPYQNKRNSYGNTRNVNSFANKPNPWINSGKNAQILYNQNTFGTIGGVGNNAQILHNQNTCATIVGSGNFGLNSGCCLFHPLQVPFNFCQSCLCNRNGFISNGLNFNMNSSANLADLLSTGYNALGCNGSSAVTPTYCNGSCCSLNNGTNSVSSSANNCNQSVKNTAGCTANSYISNYQHGNNLKKLIDLTGGGTQTGSNDNSNSNNGENVLKAAGPCFTNPKMDTTDANIEDPTIENNKNPIERKNIASVLGITPKDLEIDSIPSMLAMMQEILRHGVTINLFPKHRNQSESNSEKGAE